MYVLYFDLVVFPRCTRNPVGWIDCVAWRLALPKILVACDAKRSSRSDLLDASMIASELNAPCCDVVNEPTTDKLQHCTMVFSSCRISSFYPLDPQESSKAHQGH
jgi:hypothetical protein